MINRQQLKKYENIALSDSDIKRRLNGYTNIVLYSDIHKYKHLDELFNGTNNVVILYEKEPQYGHWTCVLKLNRENVEFFNSYGGIEAGFPDTPLSKISNRFRRESDQDFPYLSQLLIDSPYNLSYNENKLQKRGADIKTCGRHVIYRIKNGNLSLEQYIRKLNKQCAEYGTDYDGVVTIETI